MTYELHHLSRAFPIFGWGYASLVGINIPKGSRIFPSCVRTDWSVRRMNGLVQLIYGLFVDNDGLWLTDCGPLFWRSVNFTDYYLAKYERSGPSLSPLLLTDHFLECMDLKRNDDDNELMTDNTG